MSFIKGETKSEIDAWVTASGLKESTGASAFGMDLSEWPAREVDIWRVLSNENAKFDAAREEAER